MGPSFDKKNESYNITDFLYEGLLKMIIQMLQETRNYKCQQRIKNCSTTMR